MMVVSPDEKEIEAAGLFIGEESYSLEIHRGISSMRY